MLTYGQTRFAKNGFSVVEVLRTDETGTEEVVGFAVLNPDGDELEMFGSYDEALAECERAADDHEPRRTGPSP